MVRRASRTWRWVFEFSAPKVVSTRKEGVKWPTINQVGNGATALGQASCTGQSLLGSSGFWLWELSIWPFSAIKAEWKKDLTTDGADKGEG